MKTQSIRLTAVMLEQLRREARANSRSLRGETELLLKEALDARIMSKEIK